LTSKSRKRLKMKASERLMKFLEDQKDPGSWSNRELHEAIKASLQSEATPFVHKAVFIHGFWIGVVLIALCFGLATKGSLIYDAVNHTSEVKSATDNK